METSKKLRFLSQGRNESQWKEHNRVIQIKRRRNIWRGKLRNVMITAWEFKRYQHYNLSESLILAWKAYKAMKKK